MQRLICSRRFTMPTICCCLTNVSLEPHLILRNSPMTYKQRLLKVQCSLRSGRRLGNWPITCDQLPWLSGQEHTTLDCTEGLPNLSPCSNSRARSTGLPSPMHLNTEYSWVTITSEEAQYALDAVNGSLCLQSII